MTGFLKILWFFAVHEISRLDFIQNKIRYTENGKSAGFRKLLIQVLYRSSRKIYQYTRMLDDRDRSESDFRRR